MCTRLIGLTLIWRPNALAFCRSTWRRNCRASLVADGAAKCAVTHWSRRSRCSTHYNPKLCRTICLPLPDSLPQRCLRVRLGSRRCCARQSVQQWTCPHLSKYVGPGNGVRGLESEKRNSMGKSELGVSSMSIKHEQCIWQAIASDG